MRHAIPTTIRRAAISLLAVAALVSTAAAQSGDLRVMYGFSGVSRPHCWTPILIEINPGMLNGPFQGMASIYPSGTTDAEPGRFAAPVTLSGPVAGGSGGVDRFWLYVRPGTGPFRATLTLDDRRLLKSAMLGNPDCEPRKALFLSAGNSAVVAAALNLELRLAGDEKFRPYAQYYDSARIETSRLPDRELGYDGVNTLILFNPDVDRELRQDQMDAIVQYVSDGGRLVVFINRQWQQFARSRLAEVLPASLGPLTTLPDLRPLMALGGPVPVPPIEGELSVPAMQPRSGASVLLRSGTVPVVVSRPYGMGHVVLVGLDVDSQALRTWQRTPLAVVAMLGAVADKPTDLSTNSFPVGAMTEEFIRPRGGFGSVAFVWAVILFTIGYVLFVGPGLYLVLRVLKRLDLSWPVYFAVSLVVAVGCFTLVAVVRNRAIQVRTMTIVDFPPDGRTPVGRSYHSVRLPNSGVYDLMPDAPQGWLAMRASDDLSLGLVWASSRLFDYRTERSAADGAERLGISDMAVKSNQFRYLESFWRAPVKSPAEISLRGSSAGLRGTIRVGDAQIRDAVLVSRQWSCQLPSRIRAGVDITVDGLPWRKTEDFLRDSLARKLAGAEASGAVGYRDPEDDHETAERDILIDVALASFTDLYRQRPLGPMDSQWGGNQYQPTISRRGDAARLDLSALLQDSECAVLVGLADIEARDGVRINDQTATPRRRLVVVRQVVPLLGDSPFEDH